MMTKQALIDDLSRVQPPDPRSARCYAEQRPLLVQRVNRILLSHPDFERLVGARNREAMLRNHRNHSLFMAALFEDFDAERLVEGMLWVFSTYRILGFAAAYWEVQLAAWRLAFSELLDPVSREQLLPVYLWLEAHLEDFARAAASERRFEDPAVETGDGFAPEGDVSTGPDQAKPPKRDGGVAPGPVRKIPLVSLPVPEFDDARIGAAGNDPQLLRIIEATPLAMCVTDEHGYFEYVNPAYCTFYGYAPRELIGRHFTLIVPPERQALLRELHDRFIDDGAEIRGEWTVLDREGQAHQILADAARIVGRDGRPRKVTFIMDITARREAERVREDVERMMRHDLKTPLNAVINIPSLLLDAPNLTPDQVQLLQIMETSGATMMNMIDFSLKLHALESGRYRIQGDEVDLLSVAAQVMMETFHAVPDKGVDIRLLFNDLPPGPEAVCPVWGERLLYYNLLANLVKNAVEASPSDHAVTIAIRTPGERLFIAIHNWGLIPEAIRPRFFEKYATHGKYGGTGLGTYSARLIAETLGGVISFTTDAARGTELRVWLPRDSRPAPETAGTGQGGLSG